MIPTFLFFALIGCTFFANRFMNENKRFLVFRSGCSRPRWWFSATLLLAVACYGQQTQPRRQQSVKGASQPTAPIGEREVLATFGGAIGMGLC